MPRITPIKSKSDLPAEHQPVADAVLKVYGDIRGPWTMLLHSPKLTAKMLPLTPFFWHESIVEGKLRSVGILAAVREREAAYVWAAQVGMARKNGVREEFIDLLRAKGDAGKLPVPERDIVNYVRQLSRANRVDQATFEALRNRFGPQWLVELTATIGYFGLVSGMANAFEVAAPPDGDKLPSQ
ncbi:MAG: carboxymuconolactone decarboxylase family protein [Burkholderiales bacterium]